MTFRYESLAEKAEYQLEVKKSKFLSVAGPVQNAEEVSSNLLWVPGPSGEGRHRLRVRVAYTGLRWLSRANLGGRPLVAAVRKQSVRLAEAVVTPLSNP